MCKSFYTSEKLIHGHADAIRVLNCCLRCTKMCLGKFRRCRVTALMLHGSLTGHFLDEGHIDFAETVIERAAFLVETLDDPSKGGHSRYGGLVSAVTQEYYLSRIYMVRFAAL